MSNRHRFTLKAKTLIALSVILISSALLVEAVRYTSSQTDQWVDWARIAWRYFQPTVAVNPTTGLHYAVSTWHYFTDWDLARYIIAIIHAEKLGIVSTGGSWGADYRINMILNFLQTRKLRSDGLPYWAYSADDPSRIDFSGSTNAADTGGLLVALHLLKQSRPTLASTINSVVERCRSAYQTHLLKNKRLIGTSNYYGYYAAQGFNFFGFDVSDALQDMQRLQTAPTVTVYDVALPKTNTLCEPFLHGILELNLNGLFKDFAQRAYLAQERRYTRDGKLTAFTEGQYDVSSYPYIFEFILHGSGETWIIYYYDAETQSLVRIPTTVTPVVYAKACFGLHAIYRTAYTQTLVNTVLTTQSDKGFREGVYEGQTHIVDRLTDKTNSMIISVAYYATHKPDFTISASPSSKTIAAGQSATYSITLTSANSFTASISMSVTGLHSTMTTTWTVNPVTLQPNGQATTQLTVTTTSSTPIGSYTLTVTATGSGQSHSTQVTLLVKTTSTITIECIPNSITLGGSATITGQINPSHPSAPVTLAYSLDGGATWNGFMILNTDSAGSYLTAWKPQYPLTYILRASWNGDSDHFGAESTSPYPQITVSGTMPKQPKLIMTLSQLSMAKGGTATVTVKVFNPTTENLQSTLYIEIRGPNGYYEIQFQPIEVPSGPASYETYTFDWQIPDDIDPGRYEITSSLTPPWIGAYDLGQIEIIDV